MLRLAYVLVLCINDYIRSKMRACLALANILTFLEHMY
jgi:hypothetical protein